MDITAAMSKYHLDFSAEPYPMIHDVMEARYEKLGDWNEFLNQWYDHLSTQKTDRADVLLLEAASLLKGEKGITQLIKRWGTDQPRAYLYWIQYLYEEKKFKKTFQVGEESIEIISNKRFKAHISDYMIDAAKALGSAPFLLKGRTEKLLATSSETDFISLMKEAEKQKEKDHILEMILNEHRSKKGSFRLNNYLYAKLLILSGKFNDAFKLVQKNSCVGWSTEPTGLLFGSILSIITQHSEKNSMTQSVLSTYADSSGNAWSSSSDDSTYLSDKILLALKECAFESKERQKYFNWAKKIGSERVDYIVSNKYRRVYKKAAQVLVSLSECMLILKNDRDLAEDFILEYYQRKYNRFSAFRTEVKEHISLSQTLKGFRL